MGTPCHSVLDTESIFITAIYRRTAVGGLRGRHCERRAATRGNPDTHPAPSHFRFLIFPCLEKNMSVCIIHLMSNEPNTCRKYLLPKLVDAYWDNKPHSFTEQRNLQKKKAAALVATLVYIRNGSKFIEQFEQKNTCPPSVWRNQ